MGMSWKKPPPVVAIGGTEEYLRDREIRNAVLVSQRAGREVIRADSESEASDALTAAETFGSPCLVVLPVKEASPELVQEILDAKSPDASLLLYVKGVFDEKKFPALALVHGGCRVQHLRPTSRSGLKKAAVRFSRVEADNLLPGKGALPAKLAEALVGAVGTDLGVIHYELDKICTLARVRGLTEISKGCVQDLVRANNDVDMAPLREALKARNAARVAGALDRMRRRAPDDPVMLLLRARGGPSDLAVSWLKASLLPKGLPKERKADRLGASPWQYDKDITPALRRWDVPALRELVSDLARVDRGVFLGAPSPWVALESALLRACASRR